MREAKSNIMPSTLSLPPLKNTVNEVSREKTRRDEKKLEICITSFEFELECASFIRTCDSQDCTRSHESIKYVFRKIGFSRIKKNSE
jgi:hypothetical protein